MAKRPLLVGCLLVILCVWLGRSQGMIPGEEDTIQQASELLTSQTPLYIQGRVCERSEEAFHVTSITILQTASGQSSISLPKEYKIICYYPQAISERKPKLGSTVLVTGHFYALEEAGNPGQFDALDYYGSKRICGKLFQTRVLQISDTYNLLTEGLYQIRCYLSNKVYELLPEREASVLNTVLLGESDRMDKGTKNLYKVGGILHIAAISGLHVTLLAMGLYRMLRKCRMPMIPAYLVSGGLLILYGIMTGLSVSAVRAITMFLIKILAELLGRTYDMLIGLGAVAAVMVLQNPEYLQDAGFLLSFGAVLGIGLIMPLLQSTCHKGRGRIQRKVYAGRRAVLYKKAEKCMQSLRNSVYASLSVNLVILPVQLWFFFEVPVYSVFINLLIIPTVKFLMLLGLILMLVPWTDYLAVPINHLLEWYRQVCLWGQELPGYLWTTGRPEGWQIAVYYGLLIWALLWRSRRGNSRSSDGKKGRMPERNEQSALKLSGVWRKAIFWFSVLAAVFVLGRKPTGETRVTFLDVGQGDCVCVETGEGRTYLFDCGSSSEAQVGEYILKPYLKYRGIRQVDGLFLSHPDTDHCSGAIELLKNQEEWGIRVKQIILPRPAGVEEFYEVDIPKGNCESVLELASPQVWKQAGTQVWEQAGARVWELARAANEAGVAVTFVSAGDYVEQEDFQLLCLHPRRAGSYVDENEASQCFYLRLKADGSKKLAAWAYKETASPPAVQLYKETASTSAVELCKEKASTSAAPIKDDAFSILLTGDVGGAGEQELLKQLQYYGIRQVDVLKVPHHGSRNACSAELLEQIHPTFAVISCGRNNKSTMGSIQFNDTNSVKMA